MKRLSIFLVFGLVSLAAANDHNNLDSGRPLRLEDAYSIAFGERVFEFGFRMDTFRRAAHAYIGKAEFKYGFAKNQDFGIGFEPAYLSGNRSFDAGNVELSYFNGIRREIGNAPALGYRVDVELPTGRDAEGVEFHLRGIATKALRQYDKVHLNLDLRASTNREPGERNLTWGAVFGYSTPVGYPRRFDQTFLAEFGFEQSPMRGGGYTGSIGIGLRQQVSERSVFDLGLQGDVFTTQGGVRSPFRAVIGYSLSF